MKEGKNEVAPEEPGKMGYLQSWVKGVSEWANGTIEGNGIWKSESVDRRFKTAQYMCVCVCVVVTLRACKFNIHTFHVLEREFMCVIGSENEERLLSCTALTDWWL
jgi:hypothetical protein